jgi:putative inorganic carbon (hco3(-)) transporter
MLAFAALTGPLPKVGVVIVAVLSAAALLASDPRARARAVAGALILAPVLLVAEIWRSPQIAFVHRHPLFGLVAAVIGLALMAGLAAIIARRPSVLDVLEISALNFRVRFDSGLT